MYTPQESAEIQMYRQKVNAGTITKEELQRGMDLLRRARAGAHATSAASKEKKSAAAARKNIDSNSLLGELDGLG
jgi:hypothetical protein